VVDSVGSGSGVGIGVINDVLLIDSEGVGVEVSVDVSVDCLLEKRLRILSVSSLIIKRLDCPKPIHCR
jgi:hypothetical protein